MAVLEFEQLTFKEEENTIRTSFLDIYYFDIQKENLSNIGDFIIKENSIEFPKISEKKAWNKFDLILAKGFNNLTNKISGNKTIYVHQNSGIPLIGSNSFGIVDRDTNLIEIKPITSCNLNCIFCSVDEGKDTKKKLDFVVEKDYLIDEFKKLIKFKECKPIYAYINVHGEPLLYNNIIELIRDLKALGAVTGIITNGTLLNEKIIDNLKEAGLDRINISLSSIDEKLAMKLAGIEYNHKKILEMIEYANKKLEVVVAPVYLKGLNDDEIDKIIQFIKKIRKNNFPLIGIQNFFGYKLGRNPVKQIPWDEFDKKIKTWEEKHKIDLREDNFYKVVKTKKLEKPFKKNDIVEVEIICRDRYPNQCIAKANNRVISIMDCDQDKGNIKVRILRDKHNIFVGSV